MILYDWHLSLTMFSRFIHIVASITTSFPFEFEYYISWIYHIICLLISWLTFGLFPFFGYYKKCCYEHSSTGFCADMFSFLLGIYFGNKIIGSCGNSV